MTRGDPEGPLRWTSKSLRKLSAELHALGHEEASPSLISNLLYDLGYSLQANAKTLEGSGHPDRDAQFQHIADRVTEFQEAGEPVISVDAKKKELVGAFKNAGRELRPVGDPEPVRVYDFVLAAGRATPYGIYDITQNEGWVSVGADHDTSAFAVQSIRRWWEAMGRATYPNATRLLITADGIRDRTSCSIEVYRPRLLGHKVGVLARWCRRAMLRSFEAPHSCSCLRRRGRPRDGPGAAGG